MFFILFGVRSGLLLHISLKAGNENSEIMGNSSKASFPKLSGTYVIIVKVKLIFFKEMLS